MVNIIVACISAVSAIIVGVMSFIGVVITNNKAKAELGKQFEVAKAVTDTKIEALTREVREHNNFAKRMPVVEEKINVINHRIADLEEYHKGV